MKDIFLITLIGSISGIVGTGLGGILSFFIEEKGKRLLSFILEFSAGLMLSVVCFDLLPEAFSRGGLKISVIGIVFGVCAIIFLQNIIMTKSKTLKSKNRLLGTGILMAVGIALHNFPEGLAVGSGFEASRVLGINLAIVIALHDIPEGLAMALPLKAGGLKSIKVFLYACLTGVPMAIGAFLGAILGEISNFAITLCLSFAGGAMLYVICGDIIPESKRLYSGRFSAIGNIIGIIIGIFISFGIH